MSLFSYEVNGRVAEILFNNPPVNALTQALLGDFLDALERASHDPGVRAVIIGSQVPGRFSAGLDLTAVHTGAHQKVRALLDLLYVRMTEVQFRMGKPTIAAVGGTARGGGMTIAISCDMVVASSDATFGYPEIDAGVLPSIHFTHLPRIVGRHRAFELLFTGRAFDAQEAQSLGLVSRLTEPGKAGWRQHEARGRRLGGSGLRRLKLQWLGRQRSGDEPAPDHRRHQSRSPGGRGQSVEQGCSIPCAAATPAEA